MDKLPVIFGMQPEILEDCAFKNSDINEAIDLLAELIWHNGGFRFRKHGSHTKYITRTYYCAQDKAVFSRSSKKNRDKSQMDRFLCASKLTLQSSFDDRTMRLITCHDYHLPYAENYLSEKIREFIENHSRSQSPTEIFQHIQELTVPGYQIDIQSQIYYLWQKVSTKYWHRRENRIDSAKLLLKEKGEMSRQLDFSEGNYHGLAFYINALTSLLASKAKQSAIDATYGTNNAGCDLFAVLAEFDGTGVLLTFIFVEKSVPSSSSVICVTGKMTQLLTEFLRPLLNLGFNLYFLGCDKDRSEINAIKQVWPSAKVQLCF